MRDHVVPAESESEKDARYSPSCCLDTLINILSRRKMLSEYKLVFLDVTLLFGIVVFVELVDGMLRLRNSFLPSCR